MYWITSEGLTQESMKRWVSWSENV